MHEAALRGGTPEPEADPGCFLAGAGVITCLALRTTPALYPALALALGGTLLQLPALAARVPRPQLRGSWLLPFQVGVALPLLLGLPAAAAARPLWLVPFWLAVFTLSGWALLRYGARSLSHLRWRHSGSAGSAAAGEQGQRDPWVLHAASRRLAEDSTAELRELLRGVPASPRTPHGRQALRLESARAFLERDLATARRLAAELLETPFDLEEGRQFRAWAAYLELAAGCPRTAGQLAEAALGPHALAGEAWFEHCSTLQAWALAEQGFADEAQALTRFILTNTRPRSPYRNTLYALLSRTASSRNEACAVWDVKAPALRTPPPPRSVDERDSLAMGWRCRELARAGQSHEARETGARAASAAGSPYARALVHVDLGYAELELGQPEPALEQFARARAEWPWLPAGEEGRAVALSALGRAAEAERVRSEAALRFPEHRAALGAPPQVAAR